MCEEGTKPGAIRSSRPDSLHDVAQCDLSSALAGSDQRRYLKSAYALSPEPDVNCSKNPSTNRAFKTLCISNLQWVTTHYIQIIKIIDLFVILS